MQEVERGRTVEEVLLGDALEQLRTLDAESVYTCVTSPPYYNLRDYGTDGQIGEEKTPEEYVEKLVTVFREVRRVLRPDGTLWLNIGDSYASKTGRYTPGEADKNVCGKLSRGTPKGYKHKDLIGVPWMLAFALRADGWYLRQDIVWEKPNAMPESVKDRCTKSHEYIFLLAKSDKYYFDHAAIREPRISCKYDARPVAGSRGAFGPKQGRLRGSGNLQKKYRPTPGTAHLGGNIPYSGESELRSKRDVWHVATRGCRGDHFAVFPEQLIEPCVLAGCPEGGTVLDPFTGSGTTGAVAKRLRRNFIGVEINPEYRKMAQDRICATQIEYEQLMM